MRNSMKGFSLLEVIIAFVIVGIMSVSALPAFINMNKLSYKTEINLNLPSVGQSALNEQTTTTSIYQDLADTTTSVSELPNGLTKYSATVSNSGYTYAIDTLQANINAESGNITSALFSEQYSSVPSMASQPTSSTIYACQQCSYGVPNDAQDDFAVFGEQYVEIRAGNDGIISYGLVFWNPTNSNKQNYIIIATPGNLDLDNVHSKNVEKQFSYVAFQYKRTKGLPTEQPSVGAVCSIQNGSGGKTQNIQAVITNLPGKGTYLFPQGVNDSTVVKQYKLIAKENENAAAWWNLGLSIKFLQGTPTANQWIRIYMPDSSGEVTVPIPASTNDVVVANTYTPYTFQVDQNAVNGLITWDSISFVLSDNASVTLKVKTDSMTNPYVFRAEGYANPMKIILRQYNLPTNETLHLQFTIDSIDKTMPASIKDIKVSYRVVP